MIGTMCLVVLAWDERIFIDGADRGMVSSSLVVVGGGIRLSHMVGAPRGHECETFRPFCR